MASIKKIAMAALALTGGLASGAAQAALIDRGGGLIYDSDLNITWLADANYAQTSGFDADGRMTWSAANAWAAGLTYGGYSDWRLPTSDTCSGFDCTGSELGHLFYQELGGTAGLSILASGDPDLSLFQNTQLGGYWSGTAYAPLPAEGAWYFNTADGGQRFHHQDSTSYAWAVRPGDVTALQTVAEPMSLALVGLGLGALAVGCRRRSL